MTKGAKRPVGRPKKGKTADKRFYMRLEDRQHKAWSGAAINAGYTRDGEKANVSAWLKDLADKESGYS